ncbi:MAG: hypothetical protein U0354_14275 [Candidatus Sericytochromatia bacterium]
MNKLIKLSLVTILLSSCTNNVSLTNTDLNKDLNNRIKSSFTNIIKGKVDWGKNFSIKATVGDIAPYGTVSLLYPHDHLTLANRTIATGLTDSSGNFNINTGFSPVNNEMYILEVFKRLGGIGSHLMSLRTFIRYNGTAWETISSPSIVINNKTTALCIISNTEPISSSLTIGTITSNGTTPNDIATTSVTATLINSVSTLVDNVLTANYDPMKYIAKQSGNYVNTNP